MASSVDSMREAWLKENYYSVAERAVMQSRTVKNEEGVVQYTYVPPVLPEQLSSSKAQDEARALLLQVKEEHVGAIADVVEGAWKVFFGKQPDFMKSFEQEIRLKWLHEHFYDMVRTIVEAEAFEYVPLVDPKVLKSAAARAEAVSLISRVR